MARKKQIFSLFVALSCVLLGTTSCQSKHTHDYHITNKIEATCEEQGKITYTCDCGDYYETIIDKKGHVLSENYKFDDEQHWLYCTVCEKPSEKENHNLKEEIITESTCDKEGKAKLSCACGYEHDKTLPKKEHEYIWKFNDTEHWKECNLCHTTLEDSKEKHNHSELIHEEASTCLKKGKKIFQCACGHQNEEELDFANHSYTKVQYDETNHWNICETCNQSEGILTPHTFKEEVISAATCDEKGSTRVYCDCGYSYTKEIDVLGHQLDKTKVVSKNSSGHFYQCTTCKQSVKEEHNLEACDCPNGNHRLPTCAKEGHEDYRCTICDYLDERSIPKTNNHTPSSTWASNGTHHWHTCLVEDCDAKLDEEQHNFVTVTTEATCVVDGKEESKCETCGYVRSTKILKAPGHRYVDTILEPATCAKEGRMQRICSVCGDEVVETIEKEQHTWDSYKADDNYHWKACSICGVEQTTKKNHTYVEEILEEATCTTSGKSRFTCSVCQHSYEKVTTKSHNYVSNGDYVDPTCTSYGHHTETCTYCNNTIEVTDTSLGYAEHQLTYHEAKAATETEDGNINYWECSACHKYFSSKNAEKELTKDEVFIKKVSTIEVESIAKLLEAGASLNDNEESYNYYQFSAKISAIDLDERLITLTDDSEQTISFVLSVDTNIDTLKVNDTMKIKAKLSKSSGTVSLSSLTILDIQSTETKYSIHITNNDITLNNIFALDQAGNSYQENTNYYNVLNYGDTIYLECWDYYNGAYLQSLIVNGKSYTLTNGQSAKITVTEDIYVEAIFSKTRSNNLTADNLETNESGTTKSINGYVSYTYVGATNEYGRWYANSRTRFNLDNAYLEKVIIQFEDYNTQELSSNKIYAGTDDSHKAEVTYSISNLTATLTFDTTNQYQYFEYVSNVQTRIASIQFVYSTYNTLKVA